MTIALLGETVTLTKSLSDMIVTCFAYLVPLPPSSWQHSEATTLLPKILKNLRSM